MVRDREEATERSTKKGAPPLSGRPYPVLKKGFREAKHTKGERLTRLLSQKLQKGREKSHFLLFAWEKKKVSSARRWGMGVRPGDAHIGQ